MMDTAGFEMYDLGRDVPPEAFVKKAIEIQSTVNLYFYANDNYNDWNENGD